jgi:hypothetical protein
VHDNRVVVGGHARDKAGGKTKNADQTISIDRATVAALRRWAHGAGRRASVLRWRLSPRRQRVHLRGRPPAPPRHDQAAFRRPRSSRRLSRITFHDLRHSYATGAVKADINPKVVASGLDTQMSGTSCRPMRMSSQMMTAKLLSRRPHPDRQRVGNVRRRRQFRWLAKLMLPNAFPSGMKMTPEVAPLESFPLVALSQFCSNTLLTGVQDDASVTDGRNYVPSPARQRRRITARLRAEVVEHYMAGMSCRRVAATLELGRTTVLGILKTAGVDIRPQGQKY